MKAKQLLLKAIAQEGVHHVFMVPGGLVDPFLTAFDPSLKVDPIVAAQEGGAAYMADGYSRASGRFGVCLCIGGPGLTNTTTAALTAKSDHSALMIVSGEVATYMEGLGAFQDASEAGLDDYAVLESVVKRSYTVENAKLFHHHLRKIFIEMLGPVKHPVHLCLPTDVQETELPDDLVPLDRSFYRAPFIDYEAAMSILPDLQTKKIALLVGEGADYPGATEELVRLSEALALPIATTLRAKGVFPEDHPHSLGVFGYAGTRHANEVLLDPELEVLIVLGSSLNMRDSLYWTDKLNPKKKFIQINAATNDFSTRYPQSKYILGDVESFIKLISKFWIADQKPEDVRCRQEWMVEVRQKPRFFDIENTESAAIPIHPARVVAELRKAAPRNTVLFVDSGAHRAFCGHYWQAYKQGHYISATNLGPMGWAIPASIGGKLARPELPCCVVTGDGCMLMHGIEIHTAARYKIPVVFVVINNNALGNVYLRAEHEGEMARRLTSIPDRDWAGFAQALGLKSICVKEPEELEKAFKEAFASNAPFLVEIKCDKHSTTPVEAFAEAKKVWSYHD